MPKDDKKKAKTAEKKRAQPDELAASALVMITGNGHKVAHTIDTKAICGEPRIGWRYGSDRDVTCQHCKDGTKPEDITLSTVPPTFPVVGNHRANDGDDVPILCYECGEEYPCPTILAELPELKLEDLA
jgi:hypothetical protein